ncbi:serine hydrolase [Laceyella putida]|uniref:serine hydrolase n=1 Tax=Laceyella putida TaxID=110101 RepID=UPI0036D2942E
MIRENNQTIIEYQPEQPMPLASVVKVIVAIEYALQVEAQRIDPTEWVSLDELEKYYIPHTDGESHPEWLAQMERSNKISGQRVELQEVARGMILFSSNANTEFLMERLGLDRINHTLAELPFSKHQEIYPYSSAILIPTYLRMKEDLSKRQLTTRITNMSHEEYKELAIFIHQQLKEGGKLIGLFQPEMDLFKKQVIRRLK